MTIRNVSPASTVLLHQLALRTPAYVDSVDWSLMSPAEGQRLRELGIWEGASIEVLHRGGLLGGGALACQVGRMIVAMRRAHASAIEVATGEALPEAAAG
jgi:ferrous iron transport protein A